MSYKSGVKRLAALALIIGLVAPTVATIDASANEKTTDTVTRAIKDTKGHWAESHINSFISKNYIDGYGDDTFKPENKITRAEFVKLVNRAFELSDRGTVEFKDVNKSDWFYKEVSIGVEAGYISGYEDKTFRPNDFITREEAAKIVGSVSKIEVGKEVKFTDEKNVSDWAKGYINALSKDGILNGYADGTFKPKNNSTRAESVKILALAESKYKNTKITILHTNDTHGRFVGDNKVIGMDKLATIKKETPNSVLVDAGDTIHGLPFVTLSKGQDAVDIMDAVGYEFMVPGNHDFNYGYERLLELTKNLELKPGTQKMRVLSSNVKKNGQSVFTPSYIKEINGVKVGFFGISSQETTYKTNPNNVKGLDFNNPIDSAREEVSKLQKDGAEIIVGLSHVGVDESSDPTTYDVVKEVDGIDIVVDGHSHTKMPNGEKVNDTLIVSTGDYMANVGKVVLEVSKKDGKVEILSAKARHINVSDTTDILPDKDVAAKIDQVKKEQNKILSVKVGHTDTELDGVRENVRTKETNLGNLITDAMINETGADVAITNGGGIRASIKAGDITKGNVVEVLPFGNFTVTKELTGAQIKAVLEHGVKDYGTVAGSFAHVGGMKFVVDKTKPVGSRVVEITMINGDKMDMNKKYVVATNDFLAAGGDDYPEFSKIPTLNEYSALDESLSNFIQKLGTVNYKVEGRITEVK